MKFLKLKREAKKKIAIKEMLARYREAALWTCPDLFDDEDKK